MKKRKMSQTIEERINESKTDMENYKELLPFGKFKDGENTLIIDTAVPIIKQKSKFGKDQVIYTATLNGEKVRISLSQSVEIPILKGIQKKKTSFTVTKKGSGLETRYRVK